ncbi:hypothetical protein C1H46_039290 [Malus baccata]|uniref:Uncharacterized protein n=1 Tax=Malus baccata TaxID=106549 RepID=A0A540KLS5_MALBA|nr:hypothetical protein C1H46_039290 [Malus baccata]
MFSCVGGSDTRVASMLPGQLKLQPPKEALELFQRLQLLKNTHYASEGSFQKWIYGDLYLSWVYDADSYSRKNDPRS